MATYVPPQKNVEYIFYIGLISQADIKLLQNNPTLAGGDVLVSTDGGGTTNLDTLPAVTPASSDIVKVTVSADEMNGDNIIIVFSDVASSQWCDKLINIQTSARSLDAIPTVDDIWDEVLTGATHNVTASAGRRLRAAGHDTTIAREDTCQVGEDSTHVKLDSGASGTDGFYNHMWIYLTSDTGSGQVRLIDDYVGSTFVAEVHPAWLTNPDATSKYMIIATAQTFVHEIDAEGLLQINTEIVDTLATDTLSELSQAAPSATPSIKAALMLLYMIARNKLTTTGTELGIYNNAGTKIVKKTLADDGTTFTESEMESGA